MASKIMASKVMWVETWIRKWNLCKVGWHLLASTTYNFSQTTGIMKYSEMIKTKCDNKLFLFILFFVIYMFTPYKAIPPGNFEMLFRLNGLDLCGLF